MAYKQDRKQDGSFHGEASSKAKQKLKKLKTTGDKCAGGRKAKIELCVIRQSISGFKLVNRPIRDARRRLVAKATGA